MERAQEIGDTILERLSELADAHDALGDIRVQGAVIAIQVAEPEGLTLRHRLPVPQRQFNCMRVTLADGAFLAALLRPFPGSKLRRFLGSSRRTRS